MNRINCPTCKRAAIEVSRLNLGTEFLVTLACKHFLFTKVLSKIEPDKEAISVKGEKPFPFQKETIDFIFSSGARALIAHEQGLGKTVCALGAIQLKPELLPAIIVCKGNLTIQFLKQAFNWLPDTKIPQIIETARGFILPNLDIYIVSYDLLRRLAGRLDKEAMPNIKTIILDEVQHIKNSESTRAQCVQELVKGREHVLALSGTPIKNNASEYFTILNVLKPERFPSKKMFENQYLDTYWDGTRYKIGGLANVERFREQTKDFIIRYEQKEVLPDLPKLTEHFQYFDIDATLRKAYDNKVEEFSRFMDKFDDESSAYSFANYSHILEYLNAMRQIVAVAKVEPCVDYISEYLFNTSKKIVIFLHHHIARDLLVRKLDTLCTEGAFEKPINITSEDSNERREEKKNLFQNDASKRILILGTLSSGEGLDGLQEVCNKIIILERQWNPANEDQAKKRVHRIGQVNPVEIEYLLAVGTVDEFFTELVAQKRMNIGQTMGDSDVIPWSETDMVKSLVDAIMTKRGGKKWSL